MVIISRDVSVNSKPPRAFYFLRHRFFVLTKNGFDFSSVQFNLIYI